MSDSPQRPKITLEDLLRLKRAERPAPEFWNNFERELRQKQLTALLEKRPWWQELPQLLARRSYLPIGATAILAFTLVSIRYYTPAQLTQVEAPAVGRPAGFVNLPATTSPVAETAPVSSPLVNRQDQTAPRLDDRTTAAAMMTEPTAVAASTEVQMPVMIAPRADESPSALSISATLARLEQSAPELLNAVAGNRLSSPARVQEASLQATELAAMPTNASKRSRLLAQYSDRSLAPEPTAPAIVRERLARRLGDPEIFDRISRVGVRGDQVSLKF
ncbi:MAG: hypothetical protein PSW75_08985 [bacterium]|nr:hypothetical protein [bacterium]MDI1335508.1 hypothetical protein [Lacunisphaera sp.]